MQQFFRNFFKRLLVIINVLTAFLFIISSLAPHFDPRHWWFSGFLGLLFPYLLAGVCFFIVFWLFVRPKRMVINILCLLAAIPAIKNFLPFNFSADFAVEKKDSTLRVMSWNIRRFTAFDAANFNPNQLTNKPAIFAEIKKYNPDVLCLQEFFTNTEINNNIRQIQRELGFRWFIFAKDNHQQYKHYNLSGTAIFSKFPIVDSMILMYPDSSASTAENVIAADVVAHNDTFRIFTLHLQSFGFRPRDYTSFGKIRTQQDTNLVASKSLFRKMKQTFFLHASQADFLKDKIGKSPHPVIACGDLNDVPNSYAYHAVRGQLNDCFLERGTGFGKTFTSTTSRVLNILPTLRIDYIFADPFWETKQFTRMQRKLSDHNALIADLVKKENNEE